MAYIRPRKHHRVAKRTVEQAPSKGTFIQYDTRNKIILLAIVFGIVLFLKGFVLGYIASRAAGNCSL